jgi:hypothetical protein
MISLTKVRELDLAGKGAPRHLSAASGIARIDEHIYVVADDELHLGVFPLESREPGRLIRLFTGELPVPKAERKRRKPDLEAITLLPAFERFPHGALLALGSGSEANRRRGSLLGIGADGALAGLPRTIDFSDMFAALENRIPALNIEGATVSGDEFWLLQRGNTTHPDNALVRFHLSSVLDAIASGAAVGAIPPMGIDLVPIERIDGVPLTFTDGASLPGGGMVFSAVAEDTADTYNDGACIGTALGIVDRNGRLRFLERLAGCHKIEGVAATVNGTAIELMLVTDADDASIPASLFTTTLPNTVV